MRFLVLALLIASGSNIAMNHSGCGNNHNHVPSASEASPLRSTLLVTPPNLSHIANQATFDFLASAQPRHIGGGKNGGRPPFITKTCIAILATAVWAGYAGNQVANKITAEEWQKISTLNKAKKIAQGIPQEMWQEANSVVRSMVRLASEVAR